MAKTAKNYGKSWPKSDVRQLKSLAKGNTPTRVMGLKMGSVSNPPTSLLTTEKNEQQKLRKFYAAFVMW